MLVGNNFCLVIYGIFMGDKIVEILFSDLKTGPLPLNILFIQTLISTFIILITAEFLPKVFFQLYANQMVKFLLFPALFFTHYLCHFFPNFEDYGQLFEIFFKFQIRENSINIFKK